VVAVDRAMIVMHATLPIDPDDREAALELVRDLAESSREEDGVVDYRVATDAEDPDTVRVFEQYEDDDAVDAHMSSDHFRSFQNEIGSHLAGEPTLYRFDVESKTQVM
jgi:quinol monooxygenase YgiN